MNNKLTAQIEWRDGTLPISTQFDDPYFSLASGLEETRHVFLAGNNLPGRLKNGFHIAELGFGTGLNLLALALICPKDIEMSFTSFEAFPMQCEDIEAALTTFPEVEQISKPMLSSLKRGETEFDLGNIHVTLQIGDARQTLRDWAQKADAWFLDGFSPAKNPELWEEELMMEVGKHTNKTGTFATYTAAGHVREKLTAAGFQVERIKGFGRKRHMSIGIKAETSSKIEG